MASYRDNVYTKISFGKCKWGTWNMKNEQDFKFMIFFLLSNLEFVPKKSLFKLFHEGSKNDPGSSVCMRAHWKLGSIVPPTICRAAMVSP